MIKTVKSKPSKKVGSNRNYAILAVVGVVLLLTAMGSLFVLNAKQADTISKYELLEHIDNQACRYLDQQPEVNGSFKLNVDAPKDRPKLSYTCLNGQRAPGAEIQGKTIEPYSMGASVIYFSTNEEAIKYAEQKLNPLRYWGVDQAGQANGIPQTSKFTFIVTESPMYFDAYTVKANAVLRISLPCGSEDPGSCQTHAESMLDREMKGINVL